MVTRASVAAMQGTIDEEDAKNMVRQNRGRAFSAKTLAMVEGKDKVHLYSVCPFSLTPAQRERLKRRPDLKLGGSRCALR